MGGSRHSVLLSHCLYVMLHHICHRGPSPPFYLSQYILSAVIIIKVTGVPLYLSQSISSSRSCLLSSLSSLFVVVVLIIVFVVFNVLIIVSISSYSLLFVTTVTLFLSIKVNTQHLSFFICIASPPPACSSGRHHLLHRWLWAGSGVDVMHRRPFVPLIARAI